MLPEPRACPTYWCFFIALFLRELSFGLGQCIWRTFVRRSRQPLQPLRDRTMLVFFGLDGAGLYIGHPKGKAGDHPITQGGKVVEWVRSGPMCVGLDLPLWG